MTGSSAQAQLPGNSNTLAQSSLMWPLAHSQAMMMLFPDSRSYLHLHQRKAGKCSIRSSEMRETTMIDGVKSRENLIFPGLSSRKLEAVSLCFVHLTLKYWPEAWGQVRTWKVICSSSGAILVLLFQLEVAPEKQEEKSALVSQPPFSVPFQEILPGPRHPRLS